MIIETQKLLNFKIIFIFSLILIKVHLVVDFQLFTNYLNYAVPQILRDW